MDTSQNGSVLKPKWRWRSVAAVCALVVLGTSPAPAFGFGHIRGRGGGRRGNCHYGHHHHHHAQLTGDRHLLCFGGHTSVEAAGSEARDTNAASTSGRSRYLSTTIFASSRGNRFRSERDEDSTLPPPPPTTTTTSTTPDARSDVVIGAALWRACASAASGVLTAGALLLIDPAAGGCVDHCRGGYCVSPTEVGHGRVVRFFEPRAAFAIDVGGTGTGAGAGVVVDSGVGGGGNSISAPDPVAAMQPLALEDGLPPHALDDDNLPTPDAVGTMSDPNDASALSPLRSRQSSTVLDEVWSLVNKYYLDQTFNGQDWNAVRIRYEERLADGIGEKEHDDATAMKLATEMVKSLGDKYSRVLDKAAYVAIQKFDLIGVGATLMPDSDKNLVVGAPPVPGSAADKAGVKVGDYVLAVNGIPTKGRTAFDIIDQISENPNAESVTMTVLTQGPDDLLGEGHVRDVTMAREFTEVKDPVSYKITERRPDGTVVGYVRIREFNSLVKPRLEGAIKALENNGANAFVLDARSNPGGAFQSAVEIAGLFLDNAIATTVVDGNGVELPFRTPRGRVLVDGSAPIAFWVDGRSASATEVLAGALRDNCRAVVMGETSFGKGLIQAVYGLKNGSGLVLTVARYVTPGGTDIQGSGISPDMSGAPSSLLPFVLSPDTSKVDFDNVKQKLSPQMCQRPALDF